MSLPDPAFWRDKRVLLTGHTGFKGGWAALWLRRLGADVHGFAQPPDTEPNLFGLAHVADALASDMRGDLRDRAAVTHAVAAARPHIVLHMAAQPLVRRSLREPVETFATNLMGTVHLLDCLRDAPDLNAVLICTTDKVYENDGAGAPFRESDRLGGHDPYAASKAAADIATAAYARSYFDARGVPVATARGGNVIGGGDFSEDRIVPDIWRALQSGTPLVLRHPQATRPWQHVLDCVGGYLLYAEALAQRRIVPHALNFGPGRDEAVTVARLAEAMQIALGSDPAWQLSQSAEPAERPTLALDSSRARNLLGWRDRLIGEFAVAATASWYRALARGDDMAAFTRAAIDEYPAGHAGPSGATRLAS